MSLSARLSRNGFVVVQATGALIFFLLLAIAPATKGSMLLVSIKERPPGELIALALARGASLIQRGPLPSSVIVYGERSRLLVPLAREGVLTLAGGAAGCRPVTR
jgi:hypothetical protein